MGWRLLQAAGKRRGGKSHPAPAQAYLHIQITNPHDILRRGENTITIIPKSLPREKSSLDLVELQLGVIYAD